MHGGKIGPEPVYFVSDKIPLPRKWQRKVRKFLIFYTSFLLFLASGTDHKLLHGLHRALAFLKDSSHLFGDR
jgi:hypothetical protein